MSSLTKSAPTKSVAKKTGSALAAPKKKVTASHSKAHPHSGGAKKVIHTHAASKTAEAKKTSIHTKSLSTPHSKTKTTPTKATTAHAKPAFATHSKSSFGTTKTKTASTKSPHAKSTTAHAKSASPIAKNSQGQTKSISAAAKSAHRPAAKNVQGSTKSHGTHTHEKDVKKPVAKSAQIIKKPIALKSATKAAHKNTATHSTVKKSQAPKLDKSGVKGAIAKKDGAKKSTPKAATAVRREASRRKPKSTLSNIGTKLKSLFTFNS